PRGQSLCLLLDPLPLLSSSFARGDVVNAFDNILSDEEGSSPNDVIAPNLPETEAECTSDDVKDEDLGYITEPMFTQMKVEHLRPRL
ncbi:MAG: hypothetical protein ACREOZ_04105, partial [Gloeomargaritales cyanobacterium]